MRREVRLEDRTRWGMLDDIITAKSSGSLRPFVYPVQEDRFCV